MVVALATVFGGIGYVIFLIGETQLASLVQRTPELIARLQSRADALAASYPWFDVDGTFSKAPTAAKLVGAKIFHGAWSGFGLIGQLVFAFVCGPYTAVDTRYSHRQLLQAFRPARSGGAAALSG